MRNGSLLKLRIVNNIGQAVENARILLESAPVPIPDIAAMSDDHGQASISLPASGLYAIGCFAEGYKPYHFEIEATAEDAIQTLVLEKID